MTESSESREFRVLIVDDDPTIRRLVIEVLNSGPGFRVVAEAGSASEALSAAAREQPDLAITELGMAGAQELDLLRTLRKCHPDVALLVFSQHPEEKFGLRCLKAGARGFLNKGAAVEEIRRAIITAAAGRRYVSPELMESLLSRTDIEPGRRGLSARERDVLSGLVRGLRILEIAAALGIKPKSVHTYRARIFDKLGVRNDDDLVSYAIAHDLLPNGGALTVSSEDPGEERPTGAALGTCDATRPRTP